MNVEGGKIKQLIEIYGIRKGYPEKSHLKLFCEENELNYIQWNAYCRETQKLGLKIVYSLINIFPNINLNWLLKDEGNIFVNEENPSRVVLNEPKPKYSKNIGQEDIYNKLEDILIEIKKVNCKEK